MTSHHRPEIERDRTSSLRSLFSEIWHSVVWLKAAWIWTQHWLHT